MYGLSQALVGSSYRINGQNAQPDGPGHDSSSDSDGEGRSHAFSTSCPKSSLGLGHIKILTGREALVSKPSESKHLSELEKPEPMTAKARQQQLLLNPAEDGTKANKKKRRKKSKQLHATATI